MTYIIHHGFEACPTPRYTYSIHLKSVDPSKVASSMLL